jgi:hypothetical protein
MQIIFDLYSRKGLIEKKKEVASVFIAPKSQVLAIQPILELAEIAARRKHQCACTSV